MMTKKELVVLLGCLYLGLTGTLSNRCEACSDEPQPTETKIWKLTGTLSSEGSVKPVTLHVHPDGRFLESRQGFVPTSEGSDGSIAWRIGDNRYPHALSDAEYQAARIVRLAATSLWLTNKQCKVTKNTDGSTVECDSGFIKAKVTFQGDNQIDRLRFWDAQGEEIATLASWKSENGLNYASTIKIEGKGWVASA
jgi:hypothetical protein